MKAIITILFILFLGTNLQAQEAVAEQKVETIELGIVQRRQLLVKKETKIFEGATAGREVARLYRRADYRVKKALSFSTKRDRGLA